MSSPETKLVITKAMLLSQRLQLLINRNDKGYVIRNARDPVAFMYWNIVFEHHQGLLFLLQNQYPAPAFALLRVLQEAAFRSFVTMFGRDAQFAAIKKGTYRVKFEAVAGQIDAKLQMGPMVQLRTKTTIKALHGFTHGGAQQLLRQFSKADDALDIISNYSDAEVCGLVNETVVMVGLTAAFTTEFLNLVAENASALEMFAEYVRSETTN